MAGPPDIFDWLSAARSVKESTELCRLPQVMDSPGEEAIKTCISW